MRRAVAGASLLTLMFAGVCAPGLVTDGGPYSLAAYLGWAAAGPSALLLLATGGPRRWVMAATQMLVIGAAVLVAYDVSLVGAVLAGLAVVVPAALAAPWLAPGRAPYRRFNEDEVDAYHGVTALAGLASGGLMALAVLLEGEASLPELALVALTTFMAATTSQLVVLPFWLREAGGWRTMGTSVEKSAQRVMLVVFTLAIFLPDSVLPAAFVLFPILGWAAIRAHAAETHVQVLLVSVVAMIATVAGRGPFTLTGVEDAGLVETLVAYSFIASICYLLIPLALTVNRLLSTTTQVRSTNQTLAQILDAVGEGIVGVDSEGLVVFVNAEARELLGWDPDHLRGESFCHVVCGADHDVCPLELVHATGQALRGCATSYRRVGGESFPVEVNASPVEDPASRVRFGAVIAFADVTRARAVEQHKQQFVSSVSHELRTPLTSIRGVLEMLTDGDAGILPPHALDLVSTAERGVLRLGRLVDDIIDLEQLATGRFNVFARPAALRGVVSEAVAALEPLADQAGVEIDLVGVEAVDVHCDPDRVVQALVNLVGNAIKFSPPGAVVGLTTRIEPTQVEVRVTDHGRGIPPEDLPHVFDRFRQVQVTDATDKGGTGLGLTITRSIVELHGGTITASSTLGEGSTFAFTLPRPEPVSAHRSPRVERAGTA